MSGLLQDAGRPELQPACMSTAGQLHQEAFAATPFPGTIAGGCLKERFMATSRCTEATVAEFSERKDPLAECFK